MKFIPQTINKHKGVTITSRKNRFETRDQQLKQELRTSLKSSIYRIVNAYGDHLDSISILTEWHKKLHIARKLFMNKNNQYYRHKCMLYLL